MRIVVISIKPKYANLLFSGKKQYEYRRGKPSFKSGTRVVVYSTKPEKCFTGDFKVGSILHHDLPSLWNITGSNGGISHKELLTYFSGKKEGFAIEVVKPIRWKNPIPLDEIHKLLPNYNPPQYYHYLKEDHPLFDSLVDRLES